MTCWYMQSDTVCSRRQSVVLAFFYTILSNISENAVNFSEKPEGYFWRNGTLVKSGGFVPKSFALFQSQSFI